MRKYAVGFTMVALAGCAALPPPPLHAAWYLQYTPGDTQNAEKGAGNTVGEDGSGPGKTAGYRLYVALLNRSGRDIPVAEVIVNPGADAADNAWRWIPGDHGLSDELNLPKGKLVTLPFDEFAMKQDRSGKCSNPDATKKSSCGGPLAQRCILPVEIAVSLKADGRPLLELLHGRAQGDSSGVIRAELAGRMPSSLPDDWAKGCQPTSGK